MEVLRLTRGSTIFKGIIEDRWRIVGLDQIDQIATRSHVPFFTTLLAA
jgi:hypothetical protein